MTCTTWLCHLLLALPAPLCLAWYLCKTSISQGCLLVLLTHHSLLEQMSTDTFSMFPPQRVLGKGGFRGTGDGRLELVRKAEGISQSRAGVKCLICVLQPHEEIGTWSAQTSLPNPEGEISTGFPSEDNNSHLTKDEVLGQDGTYS